MKVARDNNKVSISMKGKERNDVKAAIDTLENKGVLKKTMLVEVKDELHIDFLINAK